MWEISVNGQISTCLYSVIFGAILCVFYDIIRATRKAGANSFWAVFIGDIVFWLISAVLVFLFLVAVTNGEIRGYVMFFCLAGFLLYRFTVGRLTFFVLCWLFSAFARAWCKLSDLLANICFVITERADSLFSSFSKLLLGLIQRAKKLLKSIYNLLYTKKQEENGV